MYKRFFVCIFILFYNSLVFAQSTDSIVLDSSLTNFESAFTDSINKLNSYNQMLLSSREAYNEGLYKIEESEFKDAIICFTRSIAIDSTFSKAYIARATCYENDNINLAITDYELAFSFDSTNIAPLYNIAKLQTEFDMNLALTTYNYILSLSNQESKAHYEKGVLLYLNGNINNAIESFSLSIEIKKESRALNDRGTCYRKLEKYKLAIKDYLAAIKLDASSAFIYNNLASVYRKKGDDEKAINYYKLAIGEDEDYAIAYNNRGSLYLSKSIYDKALLDIEKAISLKPDYALAYNNRGVLKHKQKKYNEALIDFDKAIKLNKDYAKAYLNRGITRQMTRDEEGACSDWELAKTLGINVARKYLINDCN